MATPDEHRVIPFRAQGGRVIDRDAAERAARDLLIALGEDVDRPGLRHTPSPRARLSVAARSASGMGRSAASGLNPRFADSIA